MHESQEAVATIDVKPALDRLLAPVFDHGAMAPASGGGLVIGILDRGVRNIYCYGAAEPGSIFEIGSVTKTFTALALAQTVVQKRVALEQPVRELLPPGTVPKPSASEISLLDLVTQRSGLPRLPDNLQPWGLLRLARGRALANPYADYGTAKLFAYLRKRGLAKPAKPNFTYSNPGFGLLGQALALRAGSSFEDLIRTQVTGPLGLNDTVIHLSPEQQSRLIPGHNRRHKPAQPWDFQDAMAGCGALRSTALDLLRFLEANLHPERFSAPSSMLLNLPLANLPDAIALTHEPRANARGNLKVAFGWLYTPATQTFWHNGGTGGYSAQIAFNPKRDLGVVVLYNRQDLDPWRRRRPRFSDLVYANVIKLLSGMEPVPLVF